MDEARRIAANIAKSRRSDLVTDIDGPACAGKGDMILEPGAKISDRVQSISIGGKEEFEGEITAIFHNALKVRIYVVRDDVGNLWNRNDIELTILAVA